MAPGARLGAEAHESIATLDSSCVCFIDQCPGSDVYFERPERGQTSQHSCDVLRCPKCGTFLC